MKIAIKTLGCKVNQSESFSLEALLIQKGHDVVGEKENPDIHVVNTCTVTAKSDYQSRQQIRRAVRTGARVIATGCYAQLKPEELKKIKGLDLIVGNSDKDRLPEYLEKLPSNASGPLVLINTPNSPLTLKPYHSNRTRAFLKIQEGCNYACSYCSVPQARGRSRSLKPDDLLRAVKGISDSGYGEIVLTGIHIGSYGLDLKKKTSLYEIVKTMIQRYPLPRIRLSSIEPNEFDHGFLSLLKKDSLCSHVHIPLQSGSDSVLRRMNRRYSTSYFRRVVEHIISACPDISIGTDLIVGFPGESDSDFVDTLDFLKKLPLSYIHVFPYSIRANTTSQSFSGHVDNILKKKRVEIALKLAKEKKIDYITRHLGKELEVIVEKNSATQGYYKGLSSNYIRALIEAKNLSAGQILTVTAVSRDSEELICRPT